MLIKQIANTAPLHLSNYEVLTHLLSLKAENDHLQSLINSRTTRKARFVRSQYPLKEDRGKTFDDSAILDEEDTQAEDEAERRGVSDDLIWVQDQVCVVSGCNHVVEWCTRCLHTPYWVPGYQYPVSDIYYPSPGTVISANTRQSNTSVRITTQPPDRPLRESLSSPTGYKIMD